MPLKVTAARRSKCRCGGILLIDEENRRTMHSLPTCAEYDKLTEGVKVEGFAVDIDEVFPGERS